MGRSLLGLAVVLIVLQGPLSRAPDQRTAEEWTAPAIPAAATEAEPAAGMQPGAPPGLGRSGRRVELTHLRTETAQVFRLPDGTHTLEQYAYPVRARIGNGWAPIDTTLQFQPDGSVRPAATVTELRLSGGGDTDLVALGNSSGQVRLGWHRKLPKPVLRGSTATYRHVMPGVDLVIKAEAAGFTQLLVVKNRKAATNPALNRLRFPLTSHGLVLTTTAYGTTLARNSKGETVFSAGTAVMWDTAKTTKTIKTRRSGGDLVVEPDKAMLASGRFPLYIDPSFAATQYRWTKVNRRLADQSYWNTYRERAMTGYAPGGAGAGDMFRSFFQFGTQPIAGSRITSAELQIVLDRTLTRQPTPVDLWHTKEIDPAQALTWNNSGGHWLAKLGVASGNAGDPQAGQEQQPDMAMGWGPAALRKLLQSGADSYSETVTLGLRSLKENDGNQWKEFYPDTAKLVVGFNHPPRTPIKVNLSRPRPCGTPTAPTMVSSRSPSFAAVASDPNTDNLTSRLSIVRADEAIQYEADSGMTTSGAAFSWPAVPDGELTPGVTYYFQARSDDRSDDGVQFGPASPKCYFRVDDVPPQTPTIESVDFPDGEPAIPARTTGTVTFRADPADSDVAEFVYGFSQDRLTNRVPAEPDGTARVSLTYWPDAGSRLYVSAADKAGNRSDTYGWALSALDNNAPIPHVRGDINGNGRADVHAVLDHGNGRTAIWNIIAGRGNIAWDSGDNGGFALHRSRPVQGDFDGDGRADIAFFREEAGRRMALHLLRSDGNQYVDPGAPAWQGTGWALSTGRITAGDVDGDDRADIAVQVDNGNGSWRVIVHKGGVPAQWLQSTTAAGDWAYSRPLLADTDGDGKDDLVTQKDLGGCRTITEVYRSTGSSFVTAPVTLHDSGTGAYCLARTKSTVGDVDRDGKDDIVAAYDYGDNDTGIWVFPAGGAPTSWWRTASQFDPARVSISAGDFTGDGKDDLAVVYAIGGGGRQLYTLPSTGVSFGARQLVWHQPAVGAVIGPQLAVEHRSYELVARYGRRCLQVRNASQADEEPVEQQPCAGALNQRFHLEEIAGTEQYMLHPVHLDGAKLDGRTRCVKAVQDGAPLIQSMCRGLAQEQVKIEYVGGTGHDSVVRLRFAHGDKCVAIQGDGTPVIEQTCATSIYQQWIWRPTVNTPQLDGNYRISAVGGGKVVDVANCATNDGADMRMADWNSASPCQRWTIKPLGDSVYQIIDPNSGKAVDVQGCSTDNLAVVHLWTANDSDCQRWRIEPAINGGWSIRQTKTGKSLDVAGCRTDAGADVIIWPYWNGPCQRWKLDKFGPNIALNRPASASSEENSELIAAKAFDGNFTTRWANDFSDTAWIYVDLGSVRSISQVTLHWETAYARQYQIQTSTDGSQWHTVHTNDFGDGGTDSITLPATNARYVKMYAWTRGTVYGYSLWEFEVS